MHIEPLEPRVLASASHLPVYRLYVADHGNDASLGAQFSPLKTMARAERIAASLSKWANVVIVSER